MTMRLSMSSFAGTARTDVAVGTSSEDSMLVTTRAAAPRRGVCTSSSTGFWAAAGFCSSRGVGSAFLASAVFGSALGSALAGSASFASALGSAFFGSALGSAFFASGAGAALGSLAAGASPFALVPLLPPVP